MGKNNFFNHSFSPLKQELVKNIIIVKQLNLILWPPLRFLNKRKKDYKNDGFI